MRMVTFIERSGNLIGIFVFICINYMKTIEIGEEFTNNCFDDDFETAIP